MESDVFYASDTLPSKEKIKKASFFEKKSPKYLHSPFFDLNFALAKGKQTPRSTSQKYPVW